MSENKPTKLEIAYHEAGHAVVNYHFGWIASHITIRPEGDTLGRVSGALNPKLGGPEYYGTKREQQAVTRQAIIMTYAGPEAERLVNPNVEPIGSDEGDAFDLLRDYPPRNCRYIGDDVYYAALERLRVKARNLVRELQPMIALIAEELVKREDLTAEEFVKLWENNQ